MTSVEICLIVASEAVDVWLRDNLGNCHGDLVKLDCESVPCVNAFSVEGT